MSHHGAVTSEPERRRGRRPGGGDTKAALMAAARAEFGVNGYDGATVRAIARRAGVDPAMVNHWFGGKEGLFAEVVLKVPFNPRELIAGILSGDRDTLGERIIRTFLTNWDAQEGGVFTALIRSVASHDQVAAAMRQFFIHHVFGQITSVLVSDDTAMLRANLVASQIIGLGLVRYVAHFEPIHKSEVETLVAAIGPTLQRYLTEPLD
jgi:AcrR family transcriptional regulator